MDYTITELYFNILILAAGGWALWELICLILCIKTKGWRNSEDREP